MGGSWKNHVCNWILSFKPRRWKFPADLDMFLHVFLKHLKIGQRVTLKTKQMHRLYKSWSPHTLNIFKICAPCGCAISRHPMLKHCGPKPRRREASAALSWRKTPRAAPQRHDCTLAAVVGRRSLFHSLQGRNFKPQAAWSTSLWGASKNRAQVADDVFTHDIKWSDSSGFGMIS